MVRHHSPGDAAQFRRGWRYECERLARNRHRPFAIPQHEELFGSIGEHRAGARVTAEGVGKPQCAVNRLALQQRFDRGVLFQRGVGQQGGVARVSTAREWCRRRCRCCGVRDAFELFGRDGITPVFIQQLGHQEAVLRGIGITRESRQQRLVPAHRLLHIGRQLVLLRQRVVVARKVREVGLDERLRTRPATWVGAAEFAVGAVAHDVVALRFQRQVVEA